MSGASGNDWGGYDPAGERLLTPEVTTKFTQAMIPQVKTVTSTNLFIDTSSPQADYSKEYEVRKVVKTHTNKKYFYVLSVSDTDEVYYMIYHGGWLSKQLYKLFGERPRYPKKEIGGTQSWGSIRKRTHLPATIGATYVQIDNQIELHKVELQHDTYAKELLDVEPENLKMIEGLEKLAEGEPEDVTQLPPAVYSSNIDVSGSGLFYGIPGGSIGYDPSATEEEDGDCDGCPDCEEEDYV